MRAGNRRYAVGQELSADISAQRRRAAAADQRPCAAVLACSDSRVPVEYLFDMGVGDLFVVRVAGNVIGMQEAGSLEYAVEHLHVPLLLVLGHTGCGAVSAALSGCSGRRSHRVAYEKNRARCTACCKAAAYPAPILCALPVWKMCIRQSAICLVSARLSRLQSTAARLRLPAHSMTLKPARLPA